MQIVPTPPESGETLTCCEFIRVWVSTCWLVQWLSVLLTAPSDPFVIIAAPRTGSTLLVNQLNLAGIPCHGEILNHLYLRYGDFRGASPERILLHAKHQLSMYSRTGCKVFQEQFESLGLTLGYFLRTIKPKVVYLYRDDLLECFVSLKIAFRTDVWYSKNENNTGESVEVDTEEFKQYVKRERDDFCAVLDLLSRLDYVRNKNLCIVSYEELMSDPESVWSGILRVIGGSQVGWPVPESVRQNPAPTVSKVRNFAQLKAMDLSNMSLSRPRRNYGEFEEKVGRMT